MIKAENHKNPCCKIRNDSIEKQDELRESGHSKKEAQKLHIDKRNLAILEHLKRAGGPFTNAEEVDMYMERNQTEQEPSHGSCR